MRFWEIFLGLVFLIGGMGVRWEWGLGLGLGVGLVVLLRIGLKKGELGAPDDFWIYLLFLAWLVLSGFLGLDWMVSSGWVLYFLSLGLMVVIGYVLGEEFLDRVVRWTIGLGVGFLILNGLKKAGFLPVMDNCSWSFLCWIRRDQHHLGDWLAWALVGFLGKKIQKLKWAWWEWGLSLGLGLGVLFSRSRSAYLAVFVGVLWVMLVGKMKRERRAWLKGIVWMMMLMVLIASFFKDSFGNRVYFVQALWGSWRYPLLGVGVGNFQVISENFNDYFGFLSSSSLTHNLFLEIMVGSGILGFGLFMWWFLKVIKRVFQKKQVLGQAMFLAMISSFMFDFNYVLLPSIGLLGLVFGALLKEEVGED